MTSLSEVKGVGIKKKVIMITTRTWEERQSIIPVKKQLKKREKIFIENEEKRSGEYEGILMK